MIIRLFAKSECDGAFHKDSSFKPRLRIELSVLCEDWWHCSFCHAITMANSGSAHIPQPSIFCVTQEEGVGITLLRYLSDALLGDRNFFQMGGDVVVRLDAVDRTELSG